VLWKIERRDFMKFISEEPKAGLKILSGLLQVTMDRLEQTSQELATIYQTGKIISGGQNLSEILKGIVEQALLAIPTAENGAAYIYNEFNAEFDPDAAPAGATELSVNRGLIRLMKEKSGGLVLDSADEIKPVEEKLFSGAVSLLASPILKDAKLLGFILLWSAKMPHAFRNSHLLLVSTVSSQLAEAIENIHHRQEERDKQRLRNARDSY
jgi:GAF domain-containing protein